MLSGAKSHVRMSGYGDQSPDEESAATSRRH